MDKRAMVESTIGKWIFALVLLLILALIISASRDKLADIWNQTKNVIRVG